MTDKRSSSASSDASEEIKRGKDYIAEAHKKLTRLAQEFADGEINRAQFQHLYDRYQRQIMTVAQLIAESNPTDWRQAVDENEAETTLLLKKSLTAKIIGYSIYNNETSMPLETIGEFSVEPELIVPMLSSYRSATAEIFQANVRSTQLENGHWLYFIPGEVATLIALFSLEPAANQLPEVQRAFNNYETANAFALEQGEAEAIDVPFLDFLQTTGLLSEKLSQ